MNLTDDLDIFFHDFGVSATFASYGAEITTSVLFDATTINELGMVTDKPQITVKESDLGDFELKLATVTISGIEYRLIKPLPSDDGFLIVTLARI